MSAEGGFGDFCSRCELAIEVKVEFELAIEVKAEVKNSEFIPPKAVFISAEGGFGDFFAEGVFVSAEGGFGDVAIADSAISVRLRAQRGPSAAR